MCSNQAHHLQYRDTALALDSKSLEPLHKLRINKKQLFWSPFTGGITDCTRKQQQTIDTLTTLNSLNSRWITCLRIACTAWVHCWRKGSSHIHWRNALARSFDEISEGKTSICWWCLIARWQEGGGVYLELHEGPLHVSPSLASLHHVFTMREIQGCSVRMMMDSSRGFGAAQGWNQFGTFWGCSFESISRALGGYIVFVQEAVQQVLDFLNKVYEGS
jgi:hypothetical protein